MRRLGCVAGEPADRARACPYHDYQYPYRDYQYPYRDYRYAYRDYQYPYRDYQYPCATEQADRAAQTQSVSIRCSGWSRPWA